MHRHSEDTRLDVSDYVVAATPEKKPAPETFKDGKSVLSKVKVENLSLPTKLYTVNSDHTITHAFNLLVKNKILSAPVFNVEKQKYIGFVDIIDILHKILHSVNEEEIRKGYESNKQKLKAISCKEIQNYSELNPYKPVDKHAPLKDVIELLLNWKARRIPIIDAGGELISVLSQSRIVIFLQDYINLFPFSKSTIEDLKLGYKDVKSVPSNTLTKDAYDLMIKNNFSGVPVTDPKTGEIVDVLNVTDLKFVEDRDLFTKLFLSVKDFVYLIQANDKGRLRKYFVSPKRKVSDVGKRFIKYKTHRMFVRDDETKKVLGVISLNDYLQLFNK